MKNTLTTMMAGAATVAAVTAGSAFMAAPAEALDLKFGQSFQFGTNTTVRITQTGLSFGSSTGDGTATIFLNDVIDPITGDTSSSWEPEIGSSGLARSVDFTPATLPFSDFLTIDLQNAGSQLSFDLLTDITTSVFDGPGNTDTFAANFEVRIRNALTGQSLGRGLLTAQVREGFIVGTDEQRSSFSISVAAVPTPGAVLPGLIGMGTAVFRKKKQDDGADVAAEPAEANA